MPNHTRTAVVPLTALVLVVATFATGAGASAAPAVSAAPAAATAVPGGCTDASGVTVLVDFTDTPDGGGLEAGCAHGPANGIAALRDAGFSVAVVQQFPAAVCRIDNAPATACVRMPPASAYWSYWSSTDHRTWTYSGQGAGYRTPPPGSVDGWSFSTGTKPTAPGIAPPPAPAATTTTAPTMAPATAVTAPATRRSPEPAVGGAAPTTSGLPGTTTATSAPDGATAGPTTTAGTTASSSVRAGAEVRARSSVKLTATPSGAGSPWGVIAGASGAGVLALAGGAIVLRRRRQAAAAQAADVDWEQEST